MRAQKLTLFARGPALSLADKLAAIALVVAAVELVIGILHLVHSQETVALMQQIASAIGIAGTKPIHDGWFAIAIKALTNPFGVGAVVSAFLMTGWLFSNAEQEVENAGPAPHASLENEMQRQIDHVIHVFAVEREALYDELANEREGRLALQARCDALQQYLESRLIAQDRANERDRKRSDIMTRMQQIRPVRIKK